MIGHIYKASAHTLNLSQFRKRLFQFKLEIYKQDNHFDLGVFTQSDDEVNNEILKNLIGTTYDVFNETLSKRRESRNKYVTKQNS